MNSDFMHDQMNIMLLSAAQQRIYLDAIFAMAGQDGFELSVMKRQDDDDRPVTYTKRIGRFRIEISCKFMADDDPLPDATKGAWEVEVSEDDPCPDDGERKVHVLYLALHAPDALRIARGLVRFYHVLTSVPERDCLQRLAPAVQASSVLAAD